jgi:hypothetical protein
MKLVKSAKIRHEDHDPHFPTRVTMSQYLPPKEDSKEVHTILVKQLDGTDAHVRISSEHHATQLRSPVYIHWCKLLAIVVSICVVFALLVSMSICIDKGSGCPADKKVLAIPLVVGTLVALPILCFHCWAQAVNYQVPVFENTMVH